MKLFSVISYLLISSSAQEIGPNGTICRPVANGAATDCHRRTDAMDIHEVILTPPIPKHGRPLKIKIKGDLRVELAQGSRVNTRRYYGGITLGHNKNDICQMAIDHKTGFKCPISPQYFELVYTIDIPYYNLTRYDISSSGFSHNKQPLFNLRFAIFQSTIPE